MTADCEWAVRVNDRYYTGTTRAEYWTLVGRLALESFELPGVELGHGVEEEDGYRELVLSVELPIEVGGDGTPGSQADEVYWAVRDDLERAGATVSDSWAEDDDTIEIEWRCEL